MTKKKIKQLMMSVLATAVFINVSSFVDEGESGGVSACLQAQTQVSGNSVDDKRCYLEVTGPDEFQGYTKKCVTGSGSCVAETCDKDINHCYVQ